MGWGSDVGARGVASCLAASAEKKCVWPWAVAGARGRVRRVVFAASFDGNTITRWRALAPGERACSSFVAVPPAPRWCLPAAFESLKAVSAAVVCG